MSIKQLFNQISNQVKNVHIDGVGDVVIGKMPLAAKLAEERLILDSAKAAGVKDFTQIAFPPSELAKIHVRFCVLDEQHQPFLTDEMLDAMPFDIVQQLHQAVQEFNGNGVALSDDAVKDAAKK